MHEYIGMTDYINQPTQPPPEKLSAIIVPHRAGAISLCLLQLATDAMKANSTLRRLGDISSSCNWWNDWRMSFGVPHSLRSSSSFLDGRRGLGSTTTRQDRPRMDIRAIPWSSNVSSCPKAWSVQHTVAGWSFSQWCCFERSILSRHWYLWET